MIWLKGARDVQIYLKWLGLIPVVVRLLYQVSYILLPRRNNTLAELILPMWYKFLECWNTYLSRHHWGPISSTKAKALSVNFCTYMFSHSSYNLFWKQLFTVCKSLEGADLKLLTAVPSKHLAGREHAITFFCIVLSKKMLKEEATTEHFLCICPLLPHVSVA